jgi:pimeloyl-ACP methyl ester carboxylesterase
MKRRTSLALCAALAGSALAPTPWAAAADPAPQAQVSTGVLNGAEFAVALPPGSWNHGVIMLAHGYRPQAAPLVADLHPERPSLKAFLGDGWIVATTSYRRNGIIVADAMADLDALRAYIAATYGEPARVILSGDSMGGLIVALMAEREAGPYQGAVAFDPTLYLSEPNATVGLSLLPRIPLLFVTTEKEAKQAIGYMTALVARPAPAVPPALFLISRQGHTNINQPERFGALRAMDAWIERGPGTLPSPGENQHYFDATVKPEPGPSTAVMHADGRGFDTRVAEVDAIHGTVLLEAQAADFNAVGITAMTYFRLGASGKTYRTLYGNNYSDVQSGLWVAFPDADGRTAMARSFENAAATAGLRVGDTVSVQMQEPGPAGSR